MGHPLIDEFCRAGELRPGMLRRFQRDFRDQIQPLLSERESLLTEVDRLRVELAHRHLADSETIRRRPGRPRKEKIDAVPA